VSFWQPVAGRRLPPLTSQAVTKTPHPPSIWLGRLGALVLGGVLLVALVTKAVDPAAFAEQIEAEGLAGPLGARTVAFLALALEAGLGALLVLQVRRRWVLLPATALVGFFLFLTGRAYWWSMRGVLPEEMASCGCFGNLVERTPAEAFWQDLALLGVPLALAFLGRSEAPRLPVRRLVVAGAFTVVTLAFAWQAPELPLDDVATRLRPGTEIASVCAGSEPRVCLPDVAPELLEGRHWVTIVDVDEAPETWVEPLNERVWSGEGPPLTVLGSATPEQLMELRFGHGPAFDVREAPAALLRPLHRSLPRSFLVEDGTVVLTSPGLPPQAGQGEEKNSGD